MIMEACYIAIVLCTVLHIASAQGVNLSVEVWIFIGLAIGLVCLIVAVVWVVFCIMLYRHQREHASDEDYHEAKDIRGKEGKRKKQRRRKKRNKKKQDRDGDLSVQTTTESEDVFDMPGPVSPLDVWVGHRRPVEASPLETAQPLSPAAIDPESTRPVKTATRDLPDPETSDDQPAAPPSIETKPYAPIPTAFESMFTPPTNLTEEEHHRKGLRVQLSNVSSSRMRKLSEVEECEVQPDVSNFPLRYGQRRTSNVNTNRAVSDYGISDPFSFNFEPSKGPGHIHDNKDYVFGQLSSWPEFN